MNQPPPRPIPIQLAGPGDRPPAARCYWVVPGGLLAGAYPGSPDPAEFRGKIQTFINAGVRQFINLQEPGELGHGGRPFACYRATVRELCPEARCERHAIRDVSVPDRAGMLAILDAIDRALAAGQPTYVHCWGGIGRTGTVVGCWLVRHGLASRADVLEKLQILRRADLDRVHRRSPETAAQERFVHEWDESADERVA